MTGVSALSSRSPLSFLPIKAQSSRCSSVSFSALPRTPCSSNPKFKCIRYSGANESRKISFLCSSSGRPGGPSSGDNDSKTVLDAFFLGKALADALTERIESGIGEILSGIGRLQAEQQKQLQDFREDIIERAKREKDKAAREALEAQGLISKSTTLSSNTDSVTSSRITENGSTTNRPPTPQTDPNSANQDSILGVSTDD